MTLSRVTQTMMMNGSRASLEAALGRLAKTQEQLSTGRVVNRPSDSPADATTAMRLRSELTTQRQQLRNAEDGRGWLGQVDASIQSSIDQVRRARNLALQGASAGSGSPQAREALAAEIDQLRDSLVGLANTTYLGRPVFGGITAGSAAYDAAGTYVGTPGAVTRAVADGVTVRVDADAADVFGATGPGTTTVFEDLTALSAALRAGDTSAIQAGIAQTQVAMDRMTTALADVGTRAARIDRAVDVVEGVRLRTTTTLSSIENVDLPRAIVDLQLQETAYQAALAATARVMQPSLLDFLR